MRRWEIRRYIQETRPFDDLLFLCAMLEKLSERKLITDEDIMNMLEDQRRMAEQPHYE